MSGYDVVIGSVYGKLDFVAGHGGGSSANGTWTFQNSTPSDAQFKNSEPGLADTSPYSARTYAAQNGSVGKLTEIEAPSDLARPYLCDLDNTRPGMIAPRLQFPFNSGGITLPATAGGSSNSGFGIGYQIDSATLGLGVLAPTTGGTDAGWWIFTYNPATHQYAATKRVFPGALGSFEQPGVNNAANLRSQFPAATYRETNGHLWLPIFASPGGGAVDALAAFSQTPVQTAVRFWHFVTLGDQLFTFEGTDASGNTPGMTISVRDPATLAVLTPSTLAGTPAPELGNANIQRSVPDVLVCYTPVVFNGAIYFATDRGVYKVVWDDNNMKIVVVPIRTAFTRVTSNPEIFLGSLFVGSGNTLWKWTPGQTEWTPLPLDTFGVLPTDKGGGTIIALLTVATGLIVQATSDPSACLDLTTMIVDANNVVAIVDEALGAASAVGVPGQVRYFVDAKSGNFSPIIGLVKDKAASTTRTVVALYESNRDPSFLPAASRKQVSGSHFWVGPFDPAENYGDRKQLLKIAAQCADVTTACKIRFYYQTDYEYLQADDLDTAGGGFGSPTGTVMAGQGKWHLAFTLTNGTTGLTNTSGSAWAGYAEKSLVAAALAYRQIRWCVEIISDTTGTVYPRLLGFKFFYSETPAMYIVHSVRLRVLAQDPDLNANLTPTPPQNASDVYTIVSTLYGYLTGGTFVNFRDLNGVDRTCKITKLIFNGVDLDDNPDGLPTLARRRVKKAIVTLALQEADSAA